MLKKIVLLILMGSMVTSCYAASRVCDRSSLCLYVFRFIEWPGPRSTWVVGVLGDDPFDGGLRELRANRFPARRSPSKP